MCVMLVQPSLAHVDGWHSSSWNKDRKQQKGKGGPHSDMDFFFSRLLTYTIKKKIVSLIPMEFRSALSYHGYMLTFVMGFK